MNFGAQLLGALIALVAGGVAAPLIFRLLVAMKSRQTISQHIQEHAHKQGTPTMGGLIVLVGLLAGLLFARWESSLIAPVVLVLGFGLVGFLDDYVVPKLKPGSRGLSWMPKLGLEVGASVVAALFMGWTDPLMIGFFVFMVLFLSNAYNFSDGLDGLAGGLGLILCLGFVAMSFVATSFGLDRWGTDVMSVAQVGAVLGASFLPFLFYNAPPAKVFMGDVGALPIGAVFGWMASVALTGYGYAQSPFTNIPLLLAILVMMGVMFAEIIPVPLQIGWVKIFKKRLFQFKTPIHHAFQERGWPETRIVWRFHLLQIVLVIIGLSVFVFGMGGR